MMIPKITFQSLRQGEYAKHRHSSLISSILIAGLLVLAGLAWPPTSPAEETTKDVLAKMVGLAKETTSEIPATLATPIKDIANMQELESTTFHVINITEHDSVLPAELRLAGKESDWAEGVCGYVNGKEIPTGLLPDGKGMRLMILVPLKPKQVKKVTFKKGKASSAPDLKVEQDGNKVVISNRQVSWTLGPNGMEQFQRDGKTFALQEAVLQNGTLKATLTPAVCRVTLHMGGASAREYLFYPNSLLWQVSADRNYQVIAGGTNAFYYSHPCTVFYGDPGSPYGAVIETGELEKGTRGMPGPKEFQLFSGADWGLLMGNAIGLGVYPNPSSFYILVDTTRRSQGIIVQAMPLDKQSNAIFKQWHWGGDKEQYCACGWWRTIVKPLGDIVSYVFGVTADVRDGTIQRSESLAPVLLRALGDRTHGAQLPWVTESRSETLCVDDRDGNGPDMLNDRWFWCDNNKPMSCFEFNDPDKDGQLDDVCIYAKWGEKIVAPDSSKQNLGDFDSDASVENKGSVPDSSELKLDDVAIHLSGKDKGDGLDAMELKYPVCALHDQTRDGKIVANCVFFGGRIDQDRFEFNSGIGVSPPDRRMIERKKAGACAGAGVFPLEVKKFDRITRALDLDGDGDMDVMEDVRKLNEPETDYQQIEQRQMNQLDLYDNNPFYGVLLDPLTGSLTVKIGFQWPFFLGQICKSGARYKGISVVGQDAVMGNMCLDGDGLPEAKLIFDGGLFGDDFIFRPVMNMIGSSLYLSNRHALSKINSYMWQEGLECSSCYTPDVGLYPIRKNAFWPFADMDLPNASMIPKRPAQDCLKTYRDKHGNEIKIIGICQPAPGWDGGLVAGSKNPAIVKDWSDAFHYDWDYLLAIFEGRHGVMTESDYCNHAPRWEFCPDYAQRREAKVFYSELDGRLHLKGATWGKDTLWAMNQQKPEFVDEFEKKEQTWAHEIYSSLDCDRMRYYATRHEAFFDEDGDGYLDSFLVDANNDGWYEDRAWYDRASRTVACMKDGILVMWGRQMEPYAEEELLVDEKNYNKLVALKRMSEERTSVLKGTTIKAKLLSISVSGTNLWVGMGGELLPQVLLDTAHGEAGIWQDLSPQGYSRLLTGLQRQQVAVRELKDKWSEESLRGASALLVAPPYKAKPDADELKSLDSFMQRGGRVMVAFPDWSAEPKGEVYALKTDKLLVPGGETGDWKGPLGIDMAMKWGAPPQVYDVKIHVSPRWDATNFYLYAEVYDRDLINKETGGNIWKGDCIEFVIGDLGEKWGWIGDFPEMSAKEKVLLETGAQARWLKWREYILACTDQGPQIYRGIDVPLRRRKGPVGGAQLEVTRQKNRTIYQLAIPWTELGQTEVKAGTEIGFALSVADRVNDREMQCVALGGGIVNARNPTVYQKLVLLDTAEAMTFYAEERVESPLDGSASASVCQKPVVIKTVAAMKAATGMLVKSPLDEFCASHGINLNNERAALMPANDPHFRKRDLGPEVSARFAGDQSTGMMKGVRKLFFNGSSLGVSGSATPLVEYQGKIIAARVGVGKGELLALCSESMLKNKHACFFSFEGGGCGVNDRPMDKFFDVKSDNNVFMDNLARYLATNSRTFKVLEASNAQLSLELVGPGRFFAEKGTKVVLGSDQAVDGKDNGDTVCFEMPAFKEPIKLKISP